MLTAVSSISMLDVGRWTFGVFRLLSFDPQHSTLNWLLISPALIEGLFGAQGIAFSA